MKFTKMHGLGNDYIYVVYVVISARHQKYLANAFLMLLQQTHLI